MAVYKARSTRKEATYTPELCGAITGEQIVAALQVAMRRLNAGSSIVERWIVRGTPLNMGRARFVQVEQDGGVVVGTTGEYPSANMVLLVDGEPLIILEQEYPAGTEFCFIHCRWVEYPWEHDLPMDEGFYRSVRRTFVGWLEQGLRQHGL